MRNNSRAPVPPKTGANAVAQFVEASIGDEKISNFAERIGISPSVFSNWKNGKTRTPTVRYLKIIAKELGREPAELYALAGMTDPDANGLPQPAPAATLEDMVMLDQDLLPEDRKLILGIVEYRRHSPK